MKVIGLYNTLIISCPHCGKESKFRVEHLPAKTPPDAPTPQNHHITPSCEETSLPDPKADAGRAINEKLHYVLEVLQAHEGGVNRNLLTDFLRATGAIRKDQEPENFPVRWLPYKRPSHLRDLGRALAEFASGGRAEWPYPPNELAKPVPWRNIILHLSRMKGHALSELTPADLFDLWKSFRPSKCKGTGGEIIDFPADAKLRSALDSAGVELGFKKE